MILPLSLGSEAMSYFPPYTPHPEVRFKDVGLDLYESGTVAECNSSFLSRV